MDVTHTRDELTPVYLGELDQVHRLLAVIAPVEVGRYPGVQLSRTRTGRVWTLIGAALGIWLDRHVPGQHSWTLALLVAGLTLGCFNAWHWVAKEDRAIRREQEDNGD